MNATITTFGCAEWLRARGYIFSGEIEYLRPRITVAEIQKAVADHFRFPVREMVSQRRHRHIVRPRQIAMYLAREITPQSLPQIGKRFGNRDHTTVWHAIHQIERLRQIDPELDSDVRAIKRELVA